MHTDRQIRHTNSKTNKQKEKGKKTRKADKTVISR